MKKRINVTQPENKGKAIMEAVEKAKMQQSIYSALRVLGEWYWGDEKILEATNILRKKATDLGREVDSLQIEAFSRDTGPAQRRDKNETQD